VPARTSTRTSSGPLRTCTGCWTRCAEEPAPEQASGGAAGSTALRRTR
jgi:hypothetical protein